MVSLIIPISREGLILNVSIISSPVTGGWKLRTWSRSSTSFILVRTTLKLLWYFLKRFGFLVVISASQSVIKSSISSPASKMSRRTAESVTSLSTIAIGRELIRTNFWTYFILSFSGRRSRLNSLNTIFAPTNSCPWKVHPIFLWNFLVGALPISCSKAAQRNQRSSVFSAILSTTSKVCQKLSLCFWPSISSMPSRAVNSGIMIWSNPVLCNSEKPFEGFSASIILCSSSVILSLEIILMRFLFLLIASKDSFSILKFSCVANRIARSIRNGSSE